MSKPTAPQSPTAASPQQPAQGVVHGTQEGEHTEAKYIERLELSEEEKAVLIECRKNSIARGILLTASSVICLRTLIATGRIPLHVQRWSSVYYSTVGAVSFLVGLRSYHQRCVDKLMALDHSVLADQLRLHQRKQQGWTEEALSSSSQLSISTPPPPQSTPSETIDTVPSDRHFSSTAIGEVSGDQPDAFGGMPSTGVSGIYEATPTQTRGRTFDEIRQENRRKQLQHRYPQEISGAREDTGKSVRVRRNKYGDIISED